jgi:hypothetical protein
VDNIPAKEKLISELTEMKYLIDFHLNELNGQHTKLELTDKFLFREMPEMLANVQYKFDELLEEENKVDTVSMSITVDNWRIIDPQEIDRINKIFDSHHVFFEIERTEVVEVQARSINSYIEVIGDGKIKYYVGDTPTTDKLSVFMNREPDIQYTPAKK